MLKIENAVAVITGGASGIGLALAHSWANAGGKVVLADMNSQRLEVAKEQIRGDVVTVTCDITHEEDNRLLAFKETLAGAGPLAEKVEEPAKEPARERVPGAAIANPD